MEKNIKFYYWILGIVVSALVILTLINPFTNKVDISFKKTKELETVIMKSSRYQAIQQYQQNQALKKPVPNTKPVLASDGEKPGKNKKDKKIDSNPIDSTNVSNHSSITTTILGDDTPVENTIILGDTQAQ
ncbi:hypothetical protein ciss_11140 [Carboxydothermus islandicus]|uniref:Uncharacterized protein n=1 Tax=Carboxydothermus islandicus TaxID=661089 RepID=A0A1L8D254_9THEO|nr:hypothetical protein [Carboxydothermus islandicus]GAV25181.1 hypothetical protein ciss_11140 [Carboxydothermus islandicus]